MVILESSWNTGYYIVILKSSWNHSCLWDCRGPIVWSTFVSCSTGTDDWLVSISSRIVMSFSIIVSSSWLFHGTGNEPKISISLFIKLSYVLPFVSSKVTSWLITIPWFAGLNSRKTFEPYSLHRYTSVLNLASNFFRSTTSTFCIRETTKY